MKEVRPNTVDREADRGVSQGAYMTDIIMLTIGITFFALSIGYAYACERL